MSGRVFRRASAADPPVAVEAAGSTIVDADGREYLDAAGGAIVVNVGHGRREIADAMADQAARLAYAHGSAFTTEPLEGMPRRSRRTSRSPTPRSTPCPAGPRRSRPRSSSPARRTSREARPDRLVVFARWGSYHGNTLGALDLSGRRPLRRPYEGWLGRFRHVSAAYPYRGDDPGSQALGTTQALVDELDQAFTMAGPGTVAAFVAEPIVGATLGAVEPPKGYWPAVADVCRRHGALLIADEVMTGFGRTGEWFGLTHYAVQPDLLVAAKGATSGYWPFGFVAASGDVFDTVTGAGPFVHGFTYSHQPTAAAVALAVLRILETESLIPASATKGERLLALLHDRLDANPAVGDIRGRGLLVGVELVRDRGTREPYPRSARLVEAIVGAARERGLLLYSGTGNANGIDGDTILLGPPFVVTDEELTRIADGLAEAIEVAVAAVGEPART